MSREDPYLKGPQELTLEERRGPILKKGRGINIGRAEGTDAETSQGINSERGRREGRGSNLRIVREMKGRMMDIRSILPGPANNGPGHTGGRRLYTSFFTSPAFFCPHSNYPDGYADNEKPIADRRGGGF